MIYPNLCFFICGILQEIGIAMIVAGNMEKGKGENS
jgi:hypothetical protein